MSWTYTKAYARTPSPMKIDSETLSHAQISARSLSPSKVGSRTPPPSKTCARTSSSKTGSKTPPSTNLIRYTSTPHLNNEKSILERKFSADSSSLLHSFAACDADSGLGDSNNKTAFTETPLFSSDDQAKTTEVAFEENDVETDFTKKPCFWYTPTP